MVDDNENMVESGEKGGNQNEFDNNSLNESQKLNDNAGYDTDIEEYSNIINGNDPTTEENDSTKVDEGNDQTKEENDQTKEEKITKGKIEELLRKRIKGEEKGEEDLDKVLKEDDEAVNVVLNEIDTTAFGLILEEVNDDNLIKIVNSADEVYKSLNNEQEVDLGKKKRIILETMIDKKFHEKESNSAELNALNNFIGELNENELKECFSQKVEDIFRTWLLKRVIESGKKELLGKLLEAGVHVSVNRIIDNNPVNLLKELKVTIPDDVKDIVGKYSNTQKENVEKNQSNEMSGNGNTNQVNSTITKESLTKKVKKTENEINEEINEHIKGINKITENKTIGELNEGEVENVKQHIEGIYKLVKGNLNIKEFLDNKLEGYEEIKNTDVKWALGKRLMRTVPYIADRLVVRPSKGVYNGIKYVAKLPVKHKKITLATLTSPVWVPLGIGVGIPSYGIYKGAKKINDVRKGKIEDKQARKEVKKQVEEGAEIKQGEGDIKNEKHNNEKIRERYQSMTLKEILKKREKRIDKLSKFVAKDNKGDILKQESGNVELSRAKRKVNIINTELLSKMASRNNVNDYKDLNLEQLIRMKSIADTEKGKMTENIKSGLDKNKKIFMEGIAEKIKEGKTKGVNAESFKKFMEKLDKDEVGYLSSALENVNYKELNKKPLKILMGVLAKQRGNVKIDGGNIKELTNKMDEVYHYATRTKGYKNNEVTKYIPDDVDRPQLHQGKDYSLLARVLFKEENLDSLKKKDGMLDYLNENIIKISIEDKDKVVFDELKNDNDKIMNKTSVKLDQNKYERYSVKELMEKRVKLTNEIIENYKEHNKNGFNVKNKLEQLVNIDNVLEKVINNTLNKKTNIGSVTNGMTNGELKSLQKLTEKMNIDKEAGLLDAIRFKLYDKKREGINEERNAPTVSPNTTPAAPPPAPPPPPAPAQTNTAPTAAPPQPNTAPEAPPPPPAPAQTNTAPTAAPPQQQTKVEVDKHYQVDPEGYKGNEKIKDIIKDFIKEGGGTDSDKQQEDRINKIINVLGEDIKGASKIEIIITHDCGLEVQIEKNGKYTLKEAKIDDKGNLNFETTPSNKVVVTESNYFKNLYSGQIGKDGKVISDRNININKIDANTKELNLKNSPSRDLSSTDKSKQSLVKKMIKHFDR